MARKLVIGRKLPEDVIYHGLLAQLPVEALLQWYNANRTYRRALAENGSLWESALSKGDWPRPPPPRPADLTPFQYARLLCSMNCSVCGRRNGRLNRFWELRVTMCARCTSSALVVPKLWHGAFIPKVVTTPIKYRHRALRTRYDAFLNGLAQLQGDAGGLANFKEARRAEKAAIEDSARVLSKWQNECAEARRRVRDAKEAAREAARIAAGKQARKAEVFGRLQQMNLGMEAERFHDQIIGDRIFDSDSPLTDRDDDDLQNLVNRLIELREAYYRERRFQVLSCVARGASSGRFPFATQPVVRSAEDFEPLPELCSLADMPLPEDAAADQVLAQQVMMSLRDSNSLTSWFYSERLCPAYQSMMSLSAMRPDLGRTDMSEMVRVLSLAVSVFVRDGARNPDDVPMVHFPFILYPEWRERPFVFDAYASANLMSLVRSCGLDPRETTWETMHQLDDRYVCWTCIGRKASAAATVFSWWAIVQHIIEHSREAGRDEQVLEYLQCAPIASALRACIPGPRPCALVWYRCQGCYLPTGDDVSFDNWRDITEHCVFSHGVVLGSVYEHDHYTVLTAPPTSKLGLLMGTSAKVIVSGVHLLRDVAPLFTGRDLTSVDNAQVKLEALFEVETLRKMQLLPN